jgi:hypothetical protein
MKKLLAILLAMALLLSASACGKDEDPHAGKYIGIAAEMMGMEMPMSEVYDGENYLELKSGGKGTLTLEGDSYKVKWSLEGEDLTVTVDGEDSDGTLKNGVISVDFMDMGLILTFEKEKTPAKEGSLAAAMEKRMEGDEFNAIRYEHAGYWELIRMDSDNPDDVVTEEDLKELKKLDIYMYLELLDDGTGVLFLDEEAPIRWKRGSVTYDGITVPYEVDGDIMELDMMDATMVFRKGFKPMPSEMVAAGMTEFMELGVKYPYTTACYENTNYTTTGEAIVTYYGVFESGEGYEYKEGYEWRVVEMKVSVTDSNARKYGFSVGSRIEDYYTTKYHDDTSVYDEETGMTTVKLFYQGQEMEGYWRTKSEYSGWHYDENGIRQSVFTGEWAFHVPVGYDGCVAGIVDKSRAPDLEDPDLEYYVTDYPADMFLFFRLN